MALAGGAAGGCAQPRRRMALLLRMPMTSGRTRAAEQQRCAGGHRLATVSRPAAVAARWAAGRAASLSHTTTAARLWCAWGRRVPALRWTPRGEACASLRHVLSARGSDGSCMRLGSRADARLRRRHRCSARCLCGRWLAPAGRSDLRTPQARPARLAVSRLAAFTRAWRQWVAWCAG